MKKKAVDELLEIFPIIPELISIKSTVPFFFKLLIQLMQLNSRVIENDYELIVIWYTQRDKGMMDGILSRCIIRSRDAATLFPPLISGYPARNQPKLM